MEEGIINDSSRMGVISLLEKLGCDQLKIASWRPLSLLCCDLKIYTKILANQLQMVIDRLINADQCGFLKGRFIAQNLMDLNSVISIAERDEIAAVVVAIDFHKAYDTVEWKSLNKILEFYNFGPKFRQMVELTQNSISAKVLNNGHLSESLQISRGLRQGDPLSCGLFDLVIEIIAIKIRNNQKIEGIMVGNNVTKKLGQYADDLWTVLKHKSECYEALLEELDKFETNVGLSVNYNKTEVMRIGSLRKSDAKYLSGKPLHWSDGPIKILGIHIGGALKHTVDKNYSEVLQKAEAVLRAWSKRSLTLLGKISIISTLVVSLFGYRLQVLPTPSKEIIDHYRRLIVSFLWNDKRPKIAYDKLTLEYKQGGLKLPDFKLKDMGLKVKWAQLDKVDRLMWSELLKPNNIKIATDVWWKCNLKVKDLNSIMTYSIYRDIVGAWAYLNFHNPMSKNQILKQ